LTGTISLASDAVMSKILNCALKGRHPFQRYPPCRSLHGLGSASALSVGSSNAEDVGTFAELTVVVESGVVVGVKVDRYLVVRPT
jgi:hypothetical protein